MGDETGSPAPPRPRQGRAGRRPWDVSTCTAASIGIATDSPASRLPEDCCVGLLAAISIDASGLSDAGPLERQEPHRRARPRLPVRPGDAALRRRRSDGRLPPLATGS